MKRIVFLLLFLPLSLSLGAQDPCAVAAHETINVNQVQAHVSSSGSIFRKPGIDAGFAAPYLPGLPERHTIFSGAVWAGGLDQAGFLRLGALTYGTPGPDAGAYTPGPLSNNIPGQPLADGCANFNRIWRVNRSDILSVQADFADNGQVDGPIPPSLQAWPGRNNPFSLDANGFALPDGQPLAPFFDRDGDGDYNPFQGDYPALEDDPATAIPDEMIWTVFHLGENGAAPLLEVQLLTFAFNCPDNEQVNRTVFTRYRFIYKGLEPLGDFRLSFWFDPDVGCYTDDYIGIDTTLQTVYFYNADPVDGDEGCACPGGVNSYCQAPPAHTMTFLNQDISSFIYYSNFSSAPAPPPTTTDPTSPVEFYRFMTGRWRDGAPITVGGDGYNPGSEEVTQYTFFSPPDDPDGWSMVTENLPEGDRRTVTSLAQPFLAAGQTWTVDLAHTFHQYEEADHIGQVTEALANIPDLQAFYESGFQNACVLAELCTDDCVWPGDTDNSGVVNSWDFLPVGVGAGETAVGPGRSPANYYWAGQNADNWQEMTFLNEADYKHLDANGDGTVNILDAAISELNYARQRPDGEMLPTVPAAYAEFDVIITHSREEVSQQSPSPLLRLVRSTVSLGTEAQPATDIYGIAFSVLYDKQLMEPLELLPVLNPPSLTAFGAADPALLITHYAIDTAAARIDLAVCRTDGLNITDFGELLQFSLQLRETAVTGNIDGTANITYEVVDLLAVNAAGEILDLGARADTVLATDVLYDPALGSENRTPVSRLDIAPNPTSGNLQISIPDGWSGAFVLEVMDISGRLVQQSTGRIGGASPAFDLPPDCTNGVYLVRLRGPDGRIAIGRVILNR